MLCVPFSVYRTEYEDDKKRKSFPSISIGAEADPGSEAESEDPAFPVYGHPDRGLMIITEVTKKD